MKHKLIILACALFLMSPAISQNTRYYGVDNHASIIGVCAKAEGQGKVKAYQFGGPHCRNKEFTALFVTAKIPAAPGQILQLEDGLIAALLEDYRGVVTFTSINGPKDAQFDGISGRTEVVHGSMNGNEGTRIWVFADNSDPVTIYVTLVETTPTPAAMALNAARTNADIARFMSSIQITDGGGT